MIESDVFNYFNPIYRLSKIMYVTSDTIKPTETTEKAQKFRLVATVALMTVYLLLTFFAYGDLRTLHPNSDKIILLNLDRVALTMEAIIMIVVYYAMYYHRNHIPTLLKYVEDADKAIFVQLNEKVARGDQMYKSRKIYLIHMACVTFLYVLDMVLDIILHERVQLYNITRLFSCLVRQCIIFQYIGLLAMAFLRMKHVNNYLLNMDVDCGLGINKGITPVLDVSVVRELYKQPKEATFKKQTAKSLDDIKMCRILHDSICDVCKDLDSIFGAFHLFCIVTTAIEQISEAFSIFLVLKVGDYGDFYTTFFRGLLQLYFNLYINFYCVFYFCDLITKESSYTKEIIQRFHLESEKNYLESELRVFSMQLKHSTLSFSAIEYFLLDWELMIEINNDITSYFIFFIQYQINMDDKDRKIPQLISTITSYFTSSSTSFEFETSTTDISTIMTTF